MARNYVQVKVAFYVPVRPIRHEGQDATPEDVDATIRRVKRTLDRSHGDWLPDVIGGEPWDMEG